MNERMRERERERERAKEPGGAISFHNGALMGTIPKAY
jgi:hypothetical protein